MGDAGGDYRRSVTPLTAALTCTCPSCGKGPLFDSFLSVTERCPACGLDLGKADSGDGPAVFIIFILGALVVPAALLLEAYAAPPYWVHVAIWPLVILAGSIALLRPLKALLIALQFKHRASDSGSQRYD